MSSQASPLARFQKSGSTVCGYVRGPRDVTSCQVKAVGCRKPKEPAQSMHNERVSSCPPVEHPNRGLVIAEDVQAFSLPVWGPAGGCNNDGQQFFVVVVFVVVVRLPLASPRSSCNRTNPTHIRRRCLHCRHPCRPW